MTPPSIARDSGEQLAGAAGGAGPEAPRRLYDGRPVALALRLFGLLDLLALAAVIMPRGGMTALSEWSGLAPLPTDPVVGYLARSGSLMYALHGAMVVFVSFDVPRYRALIRFLAWLALIHGAALYAIDWHEGMPLWWRSIEGGCVAATGVIVLWLLRRVRRVGTDQ